MSALGQKRTFAVQDVMSALPPIADICSYTSPRPLSANSGQRQSRVAHYDLPDCPMVEWGMRTLYEFGSPIFCDTNGSELGAITLSA